MHEINITQRLAEIKYYNLLLAHVWNDLASPINFITAEGSTGYLFQFIQPSDIVNTMGILYFFWYTVDQKFIQFI